MAERFDIPEAYQEVLRRYAENNNSTVQTAFSNLMDFIQLKEETFSHVLVAVEDPRQYLTDCEGMNATGILRLMMDIFGEDNVGVLVQGYYNPDRLNTLLLELQYDEELPVWNILESMHYRIPGMNLLLDGELLELRYVGDGYGTSAGEIRELEQWFMDPDREEDAFGKAGYYESVFQESEEEFQEDEDDDYDDMLNDDSEEGEESLD